MFCQFRSQSSEIAVSAGWVPRVQPEGEPARHTLPACGAGQQALASGCLAPVSLPLSVAFLDASLCPKLDLGPSVNPR